MNYSPVLAMALLASTGAGAVTVISPQPGPDQGPLATETFVVDFESPFAGLSGGLIYARGIRGPLGAAAPFGDKTHFLGVNGAATLTVSGVSTKFNSFSFYWGSIDADNTVQVYDLANTLIYTLHGSDLPVSDGNQRAAATNRRVFFTLGQGETLGAVRFSYPGPAFEVDDVAFGGTTGTVPEPAVWAMAVAGFGLVGLSTRHRRRAGRTAKAVVA